MRETHDAAAAGNSLYLYDFLVIHMRVKGRRIFIRPHNHNAGFALGVGETQHVLRLLVVVLYFLNNKTLYIQTLPHLHLALLNLILSNQIVEVFYYLFVQLVLIIVREQPQVLIIP